MATWRASLLATLLVSGVVSTSSGVAALFWAPRHWRCRLANLWIGQFLWYCKALGGLDYRVRGSENIAAPPVIYFAQHGSIWETLFFQRLIPDFVWVLKHSLMRIPILGWALATLQPIAIDRTARSRAVTQLLEQGQARLRAGLSVLIFPEGTRVAHGERRPFKRGGASLAVATAVPVIPIAHNAAAFWPPRWLAPTHSGVIEVVIGDPIDPGNDQQQINQRAQDWIAAQNRVD